MNSKTSNIITEKTDVTCKKREGETLLGRKQFLGQQGFAVQHEDVHACEEMR